ncbi:MAG: hemerythrin family protein [Magnetococcales bacterium]|nr:hemerythrin family protein [Magnetococcales bacterium]
MTTNTVARETECLLKNVGVMEFNKQHLRLASYAAEFQQLVDKLSETPPTIEDWRHIDALFGRISRFVAEHFRHEEQLMQEYDYPEYNNQKQMHNSFESKLIDVQSKIRGRDIRFTNDFCKELWEWLFHHINVVDVAYRDFFIEKGLK